jgi:hypothetical protein
MAAAKPKLSDSRRVAGLNLTVNFKDFGKFKKLHGQIQIFICKIRRGEPLVALVPHTIPYNALFRLLCQL